MPYMFLSYARADADGFLERFFTDLCEEVRRRTGEKFEDIGFRDVQNVPMGSDWRVRLAEAIASARVFVALCSPSYFASETCGREWQMFTELTRARRPGVADPSGNLLPITWRPTRQLPEAARWLQHSHADLGETYMKEGLNFVTRLRRYREDYDTFVMRFAAHIERAAGAEAPPPPSSMPVLHTMPNAFQVGPSTSESERDRVEHHAFGPVRSEAAPADPTLHGPQHVTFVVVAAPVEEVAKIREDTHFYDENPFRWSPYRPRSSRWICVSAQNIAASNDMTSELAWAFAGTSIADRHAEAKARNQILALIVDVWTTRLRRYRAVLVEYDKRYEGNAKWTSPVLVPWSSADAELSDRFPDKADLHRSFPTISGRGEALYRHDIPTIEQFKTHLDEVLTLAQSRIIASGDVRRRGGGDRQVERPYLGRPTDDDESTQP